MRSSGEKVETTLERKIRRAAEAVGPVIVGMVQRRTAQGKSFKGGALAQYRPSYKEFLREGREKLKVDLTLTGGYLADIRVLAIKIAGPIARIFIGPGTGTSPQVTADGGHMRMTGRRGPPHNVLGKYLERGTAKMQARPHLGLTGKELGRVIQWFRKALGIK